jgi:hypothetical protein
LALDWSCDSSTVSRWASSLNLSVIGVSHSGQLTVRLNNVGKETVRVWDAANSWGSTCWRVLRVRKGVLDRNYYQNPYEDFLANMPNFQTLKPGEHIDMNLDLNAGDWCDSTNCSRRGQHGIGGRAVNLEPDDLIIVIYDVADTPEGDKRGVWFGVGTASTTVRE